MIGNMTDVATSASRRHRLLVLIATPLLAVLALLSWGLSSPVGSSPDDDFHLSSIWCGHGAAPGCQMASDPTERTVYRDLAINSVCFAFNADVSAACQGSNFGDNPAAVVTTARGNFTGLYPPLYYYAMSFFAGSNIDTSVLVMRLVNCLLFVGLVSALFWLLPLARRPLLLWSLALSMVPLGMFIVPSTNPSGWAVLSAGTLWLALLGVSETSGKRRVALGIVALVATVLGAGARADAAIYAAFAVLLVLVITFRRTRKYFYVALFGVALVLIALAFYLTARQGNAVTSGLGGVSASQRDNPFILALANLINVPALWVGVFGSWNLGWLDTALPAGVWVAGFACFCGAIFLGLTARVPRKGVALIAIVLALVVVPTYLLGQSNSVVGANFQPRYLLPLIVILAGFALLYDPERPIRTTAAQRWLVIVVLSLANAIALEANIRRYVTGAHVESVNLDAGAQWWWHLPFSPMFVWIAGSLAFAGMMIGINSRVLRGADRNTLPLP